MDGNVLSIASDEEGMIVDRSDSTLLTRACAYCIHIPIRSHADASCIRLRIVTNTNAVSN
jgi:hypothetical protein